jgi:hypothetical protein
MLSLSLSTSVRLLASAAAASLLSMQPLSSFAQTAPMPAPASCAAPTLDLANPSPGEMLQPGALTVQGEALDPQAAQGSGIDQITFFLGSRDQGGIPLGVTEPASGPRLDDFSTTVTLPSTSTGEFQFVAYARSSLTGRETQVSVPIVLGESATKAQVTPSGVATESNTNPGALPSSCETPAAGAAAPMAPASVTSVPVPAVAPPASGLAAAEAAAAAAEAAPVPDSQMVRDGEDAEPQ